MVQDDNQFVTGCRQGGVRETAYTEATDKEQKGNEAIQPSFRIPADMPQDGGEGGGSVGKCQTRRTND